MHTRRRVIKSLGVSLFGAAGCATPSQNDSQPQFARCESLPTRIDYGKRLVTVGSVNQSPPLDFIVDTAASRTVLFENAAQGPISTAPDTAEISIFGLSGVRTSRLYNVGNIRIGNRQLKDHRAPILPDWRNYERTPQGVLGLDYFQDSIAEIDVANRKIDVCS